MNYYITKYCLLDGIKEINSEDKKISFIEVREDKHGDLYLFVRYKDSSFDLYFDKQWFTSKKKAIEEAERQRIEKIKELEKQIKILKKMDFN